MPAFFFVSVHQMVPPLTEVADIQLQLATHLLNASLQYTDTV